MKITRMVAGCALVLGLFSLAHAQVAYPSRPIKIINPYPPGGSSDQLARVIADRLAAALHQPVVVENKSGANGMIGAAACKQAPADGHTLCILFSDILAINPYIYKNIAYTVKDFLPVVGLATVDTLVVVRPTLGIASIKAVEGLAKAQPGKLAYSSAGIGSSPHLIGEQISKSFRVDLNHVPYQGTAPAVVALLAGQVDLTMTTYSVASQHIASGKLVPLAVLGNKRLTPLPAVPTLTEQGVPFEGQVWQGLFAPAGTPERVVATLNKAVGDVLADPEFVRQHLRPAGFTPMGGAPQELERRVSIDGAIWGGLAKSLNLKLE